MGGNNINIVNFNNNQFLQTLPNNLKQWSYGQVLRVQGLKLPNFIEIHFSLNETGGTSVTRIGITKDGVTDVPIPDFIVENEKAMKDYKAYAFIYPSSVESGTTTHKIVMNVQARPKPEAFETPTDEELFHKTIEEVNKAVVGAESFAHGGTNTRPNEDTDNAKYYYEQTKELAESGGGSGGGTVGTTDYGKLKNKPSINGNELVGNKTTEQLGINIPTKVSELTNDKKYVVEDDLPIVPTKTSQLQNDSGFLTEHQSLVEYAKKTEIPKNVSELINDSNYQTETQVNQKLSTKLNTTDISEWAKQPNKPSYTAEEVGALPSSTEIPNTDNLATKEELANKLNKNQGTENNGKILGIDSQGNVVPVVKSGGGVAELQPLTFTGAVQEVYDGTKPITVPIPTGGGSGEKPWKTETITIENPVDFFEKPLGKDINELWYKIECPEQIKIKTSFIMPLNDAYSTWSERSFTHKGHPYRYVRFAPNYLMMYCIYDSAIVPFAGPIYGSKTNSLTVKVMTENGQLPIGFKIDILYR